MFPPLLSTMPNSDSGYSDEVATNIGYFRRRPRWKIQVSAKEACWGQHWDYGVRCVMICEPIFCHIWRESLSIHCWCYKFSIWTKRKSIIILISYKQVDSTVLESNGIGFVLTAIHFFWDIDVPFPTPNICFILIPLKWFIISNENIC